MDRNLKIGVIGLGLIGGSIFKALCALNCTVFGASQSNKTLQKAKEYSKHVSKSLLIMKKCDIIFVCTPIKETPNILDKLEDIIPPDTIVADTCSIKSLLCNKKRPYKFIPTHPMAGTEFSGFDNSFEALFQGAKWILTPDKNTDKNDIKKVTDIIEVLGAKPLFTDPKTHDEAAALISHMPLLISQALFKTAQSSPFALEIASSGFRDSTRLALSNEQMAEDMINYNHECIQKALLKLYASVGELLDSNYAEQIYEIKKVRQQMYVNGKNIL